MKKTAAILTLICFILIGCKNQNGVLQVKQINTIENNIVLRYSEKMETFWAINIPISFEVSNNSSKDVKFTSCTYLYNNQIGRHSKLYLKDNVN
ncbi:hypothetical protein ULMS_17200 [Patiriisocius marinistellae]|uniref:Lipoprotein n=1 Tax=Patiriisocius marinistellae TaxID=2494560 RepID=A0A5J4FYB4_9FLAO|nr:hypothetical protein [Patiriisocius marinistellae]GEQ86212.1 hypothetical protein ULMS_17200 [Patiriisocius marinistellae]